MDKKTNKVHENLIPMKINKHAIHNVSMPRPCPLMILTTVTIKQLSISCHITSLVINSLGGGHTNTHTYRCLHRNNFKKPGTCRPAAGMHLV